ncbi:MAG: Fe-S protein assembly co-chaperone HscB [Nitrospinae bacterium]|nr:Fe-S protein assembly co-chaperone HscB [Nitrospinota bacterium]MCZ6580303.1 Fe-S protein assembly co-chaperone HscB [Nitrospirota bacterium]
MSRDLTSQPPSPVRAIPMARSMCWHCQSEIHGEYLCGRCVKVQPLSKELDYFTCLNTPRILNIDEEAVEQTFYELNRTFHPDFYANKDESEKAISLGNTALLNAAYRTLKDPIQRAEYLIRLEAGSAKEIRTAPPADLFEEILELQEDLEEFRSLSSEDGAETVGKLRAKLQADRETLERRQEQFKVRLFEKFGVWDSLQRPSVETPEIRAKKDAVLKEMQDILSNRTYVRNIVNDLIEATG